MSFVLYGLAAVAVLATGVVIWRVDPAWTVSAALALTVFAGNWGNLGLPGFPFLPDRLLLGAGIMASLLRAPGGAGRPRFQRSAVHWLLALAASYGLISAFVAHTLTTNAGFFKLTDRYGVIPFFVFGVAPLIYSTPRQRRILLGFVVATGAYLGLTALFETLNLHALVFPRYILNQNLGQGDINSQGLAVPRARGPFLDGSADGIALFDCAIGAAAAVLLWRVKWQRMFAGAVVLLCLMGCLFTLERSVWLSTALAITVAMLSSPVLRRYLPAVLLTGAVVTGLALVTVPGLASRATNRLGDQYTVWDRQNLSKAGVRMVAARPLFGFGWNRFADDSQPYLIQGGSYPLVAGGRVIHNTFLSNAVELGVVGMLIWVGAIGAALLGPLRGRGPEVWRASLVAVAMFWVTLSWLYPLTLAFPLTFVFLWAGVVVATRRGNAPSVEPWIGQPAYAGGEYIAGE